MTPTEFRDRLEAVARKTGLTASDLAVWLDCPRPTVRTWLFGMNKPMAHINGNVRWPLLQRLLWLERSDRFPIPAVRSGSRRQWMLDALEHERLRSVRAQVSNEFVF